MTTLKAIIFSLLVTNCTMGKQEKKHIENNKVAHTTLIIYGKIDSNLTYKNGLFYAVDEKAAAKLNTELKKYTVTVNQLESKKNASIANKINDNLIFSVMVKNNAQMLQDFLLGLTTIIDAAYIKPEGEEPD